jgi:CBS-domain-containing membrane protein
MGRSTRKPLTSTQRPRGSLRGRLHLKDEFILALLPTLTILAVFLLVERLTQQRFLFASLAASAFLIYLDPRHSTNAVGTLIISQMAAATVGLLCYLIIGAGFWSGGLAMLITISLMILLDRVHPPAVSTSLIFAFRAGHETNLMLFGLAVGITPPCWYSWNDSPCGSWLDIPTDEIDPALW